MSPTETFAQLAMRLSNAVFNTLYELIQLALSTR